MRSLKQEETIINNNYNYNFFININFIMKRFTLLKTMLLLCALIVGSGSAWADADVSYNFTSGWSVSGGNTLSNGVNSFTGSGAGAKAAFKVSGSSPNQYFFMGKSGAYLTFPVYPKAVERIVVTGNSGGSASAKMNIFVGGTAVSTETTGSTGTNTYIIASANQAAGNVYTLKVTSDHNAQITKIEVYYAAGDDVVATPSFSPSGGTYNTAQSVSINCGTAGATIHYTTDGTEPTTSSPTYSTALSVTSTTTIKAIAVKDGLTNSAIATATYNIVYPEASLPFAFNGGKTDIANTSGLTHSGLGSDYNVTNTKLKFDNANDELVLRINEIPGKLTFSVKGNGSNQDPWSGIFKVQESDDGLNYTDVELYNALGDEASKTITTLKSTTRYIKWIYTTKTLGNVGLGNINLTKAELVSITDAGYATYVSDNDLDYSGVTGLKAYQATLSGSKITFTKVTTVPAGEGVLLQGEEGDYNVPVTTDVAAWDADDNAFVRGTGAAVPTSDGGNHNYILSNGDAGIGFYQANGTTVATNRAYLQTTTSGARIGLNFDDETTGISAVENVEPSTSKTVVFNLNGQRIANPSKGLYIVNGKKVIIK